MSREVNRVPLDFNWPLNKVWTGFLMPEHLRALPCTVCNETGYSPEARAVAETFYPHQIGGPNADRLAWHDKIGQEEVDYLLKQGRLRIWKDGQWETLPRTAAEVNAEQHCGGFGGHDGINRTLLIRFRCERLGIERHCPRCDGEGWAYRDDEHRAAHEAWEPAQLPEGPGWQMWETTSEGSPISPVFDAPEKLARWLADNQASAFGGRTATYDQWLRMIVGPGSSISAVMTNGQLVSGVEMPA